MNKFTQIFFTTSKNSTNKFVLYATLILTFLVSNLTFAQPGNMSINQDVSGTYANTACTLKGGVYQARFQENASGTSTGTRNWQFNSDGYSNTWGTISSTKTLSAYNITIGASTSTASANWVVGGYNAFGKLPATVANYYYTYNLIKGSSYIYQKMAVLETSFNPVAVNTVSQTAGSYGGRVVGIVTSATPNAGENIYVRYSTNGYSTSTIVQATGSGTAWNATIPWQSGAVSFYVYTSNKSKATIDAEVTSFSSQEIHDLSTLNSNNNSGANYSWTPVTGNFIVTSPAGTFAAGIGYSTLTVAGGAFAALNTAASGTGAVTIIQTGDSTTETGAVTLANSANWTSLTLNPSGARTISGAAAAGAPLISFAGADNVTFNGLNAGGNSLTISNTTISATALTSTISFTLDATSNTITNCTVLGSSTGAAGITGGTIYFGAGTTTGNDNNTISNCNIGPAGANLPTKAIFCGGTSNTTDNAGLLLTNNNIYDYFGAAVASAGVYVTTGTTNISITGNKFYQSATRTQTTGSNHNAIYLFNTSTTLGYTVTGNTIGFANAAGTGSYVLVGVASTVFIPIYVSVGTTVATSIQGNTIKGIAVSGAMSGTSSSSSFTGIYVASGLTTIGDVTGNTFGDMTTTGSITFTSSSASAADINGIYNFGSAAWTTNNNNIGGVTVGNSSTAAANFYGLRCNTGSTVTWTATGNTIGGTVANSINSTSTATGTIVNGILVTAPIGTITSNTIQNMTVAGGTGTTTLASMAGIVVNTTSANQTITSNTIANLSNTNTTAATIVTGLQMTGSTANVVSRNNIYNLSSSTTSTAAEVNGIRVAGGTTVYSNNMIALGTGVSNALGAANSNSSTYGLIGINEALGTDSFFNNSVYIGGTATAGLGASIAFNGAQTTNTRSFRNNIFVNNRTNSGATGKHYAIKINGTTVNPTGLTINNNVYFGNGTGYVLGFFNSSDVASLGAWQTAVGQDAASFETNPQYIDATNASAPNLHIHPTNPTPVEGTGVDLGITIDYDGQTRSGLTPVDIGADAGNFVTSIVACVAPTTQPTAFVAGAVTSFTAAATITAATGSPTGYLSVISQGPLVGVPVDGTTYATNAVVGTNGLAIQSNASTSINANVPSNTIGTVTVFSYNSGSCTGGPKYNTVSPLVGTNTTCAGPATVAVTSAITSSGFTAGWTAAGGGGAYTITYYVDVTTDASYATPVAGSPFSTTGTSLAITGLNQATNYYWRVRANNTICDSAYLNKGLVTTICGSIAALPWNENFDAMASIGSGIVPSCWLNVTGTKAWTSQNAATTTHNAPRSTPNYMAIAFSNTTASNLWSPGFSLTAGTSYDFSFYYNTSGNTSAFIGFTGNVFVNSSQSTTGATNIGTFITATQGTGSTADVAAYVKYTVTYTPSSTGTYYFDLNVSSTSAPWYLGVDDFNLQTTPSCLPPTLTATTAITSTTATINWTAASPAPSNGYKYEIRTSGVAGSGATGLTTSGTTGAGILTANVTGLTAATSYSVYAQSDCGGSTSAWTSAGTFVSACTVPNNPGAITITLPSATGFTLNYAAASPAPTSYILFNTTGTTATAIPTLVTGTTYANATAYTLGANSYNCITNTSVSPIALSGGVSNTQYNYFLFSKTSTNSCFGAPYYSSGVTVSTITCPAAPTLPVNSGVTTNVATVSWTASIVGGGAATINYTLEVYTDLGYTTPISGSPFNMGTSVSQALTGLSAATTYYYRIKANNGCDSTYLTGTFTTACNNASLTYSQGFNSASIPVCWSSAIMPIGGTATVVQAASKISYVTSGSNPATVPQEGVNMVQYNSFSVSGDAGGEERLVSIPITSTGTSSVDVNFYYKNENNTSYNAGLYLNEGVQVQYSTNGTTWIDAGTLYTRHDGTLTAGTSQWNKKILTLPAGAGNQANLYIGFKFHSSYGDNQFLDNVVVRPTPAPIVITPSPSATICSDSSTTLTASSTTGYAYTWSPATGLNTTSGSVVIANPTTTTTYTVSGVLGSEDTTQTITVTVNPAPSAVTITPSASVCPNAITTLIASSTTSGTFNIGAGTVSSATAETPYRQSVTTNARMQYLVTKAELNAAGITGAANITSLSFFTTSAGSGAISNYSIGMANTSATALTSTFLSPTLTNVYSSAYTVVLGNNTHTFSTPFAWDGTSNVLVNICHTGPGGTAAVVKVTSTTPNTTATNSGSTACTLNTGGVTSTFRPNIVFEASIYAPITWLPTTYLYTDAGATVPYTGTVAGTVYSKATTTQTYTATATLGSCTKTNTTTIKVKTPVAITSATAASSLICLADTTTLTANGVVGDGATVTWWSATGGTGTSYGTGLTKILGPGTYYARVTGDCGAPVEASVTVGAKVNVAITNITAGANPICASATTTLTANGVVGTAALVTWWTGSGGTGTNLGTGTTLTAGPGNYYARVTGDCGAPVEANYFINTTAVPTYANLQYPASGSICLTGNYDVYGQVYQSGVTPGAGAGAGLTVEFGYNSSDSDPSTWTNWVTAPYFGQAGIGNNNDEYKYTFTPTSSGIYYYTFRYRQGTCDWLYGGYSAGGGGFWNGTTNVNGVLTVKTPVEITSATAAASPICATATTTLTANGVVGDGETVTWWSATGGTGTNYGTGLTLANAAPGTYFARVTGDCGSPAETSVTVGTKVNVAITSATAAASSICSTATTTLTANGVVGDGASVTWWSATGGTGTNYGTGLTLANAAPGTYYAYVTGDCGTPAETSVTVGTKVNVAITSATAAASPICATDTTTLTANGVVGDGATVTWWSATGGTGTNYGTGLTLANAAPGTYYAYVTGDCGTPAETSVTIGTKVNVAITSATAAASPICSTATTTLTANGVVGDGATVTWWSATGGTGTNYGTGLTLANAATGTYYAYVTGDCGTAEATVTVGAKTNVAITSVTAASNPICSGSTTTLTASGVVGDGATITWWSATGGTGTSLGSGATLVAGPGTYYAYVTGDCGAPAESSITVTTDNSTWVGGTGNWNVAANWSCNEIPTITTPVVINSGVVTVPADAEAASITMTSTATLTVSSNYDLTVAGALDVASTAAVTIQNNANLLQNGTSNNNVGTTVSIKRNSSALFRLDYTMWSSPVSGTQSLAAFSPQTAANRYYTYNENTNAFVGNNGAGTFTSAKGYLIRMPNNWVPYSVTATPASWTGTFIGKPNSGNISYAMDYSAGGYNAVGNPYPSAMSIDSFIADNSSNIEGTLWFWRKTNDANNANSYSTCTAAGSTLVNSHVYPDADYVSPGQGFIVKAKSATDVNFTNSMRAGSNTNEFFRAASRNRFWLELKNAANVSYGQKLVAYLPNATTGYDNGYDGLFIGDSQTALLSVVEGRELVIQARPTFNVEDVIPLLFKTNAAGTYSVSLSQLEGIFNSGQDILLRDNLTGTVHNLSASGAYSFATEVGAFASRFEIIYQSALSTTSFNENSVVVYNNNHNIHINSGRMTMDKVKVFDVRGRLIIEKSKVNSSEIVIDGSRIANQVLLLQITSDEGKVVTKKIVN